ncbi:hypothetical protein BD410DRAFT_847217 [Rickenella mellea]|uniref:Uncharacterized protein n=1 Tax=Rickenella mellea TaxID=50990 RepID=A0A4R5XEJ1_9AGAM|nr:hypothetical protein BD410DRAFT_847217 [Rickenella mellea]
MRNTNSRIAHLITYHRSTHHTSHTHFTTPTDLIALTTRGPTHTRVPVSALCPNARLYPTSPHYQAASRRSTATWRPALETAACHWLELRGIIRHKIEVVRRVVAYLSLTPTFQ